ncbi:hypothetical protein [Frigoribacterium sp. UYMn621]|uniref:hypothetical protein n=1 Tax=Frigoribacterium sp. UYMn621 TaxID=3156343 RepID=UPI0033961925
MLQTRKYEVHEISQSDQIVFTTRKTLTSWELNGSALVAAVDGGTQLTVVLQGQEGQPKALMDGVKNTKMAKKLVTEISGAC